eukprot:1784850-Prymnesium_polylepis.1
MQFTAKHSAKIQHSKLMITAELRKIMRDGSAAPRRRTHGRAWHLCALGHSSACVSIQMPPSQTRALELCEVPDVGANSERVTQLFDKAISSGKPATEQAIAP